MMGLLPQQQNCDIKTWWLSWQMFDVRPGDGVRMKKIFMQKVFSRSAANLSKKTSAWLMDSCLGQLHAYSTLNQNILSNFPKLCSIMPTFILVDNGFLSGIMLLVWFDYRNFLFRHKDMNYPKQSKMTFS